MKTLAAVPDRPSHKGPAHPIVEILEDLRKPVPQRFLAQRKQGGTLLTYIPWFNVVKLLDHFACGWEGTVASITTTSDRIFLTYRLTLHAAEGSFTREATGTEALNCGSYGDPSSNAESMAFRRAAVKFGLGLHLYEKE